MLDIINDWHLGVIRNAGTTVDSALTLRRYLLQQFKFFVEASSGNLLILGDLFDTYNIPTVDVYATYDILAAWLDNNVNLTLYLVPGNHDLSKSSLQLSSFQFLAKLLSRNHTNVRYISEATLIEEENAYVIPHVANQDLFNLELENVPQCKYLLVHCNYDNHFAVQSDHSLNMSQEQAERCPAEIIIFAHEHQSRQELGGKVVVIGNQEPSSIADCLNNDEKFHAQIDGDSIWLLPYWNADDHYSEQHWLDLQDTTKFIRVVGEATADEAKDVVSAISKFRSQSKAFVVSNAVKIAGRDDIDIAVSLEQIQAFDVWDSLKPLLTETELAVVENLRQKHSVV